MKRLFMMAAVAALLFFAGTPIHAQDNLLAETTQEISNKADLGYLGKVETDDAAQEVSLYFVTKTKAKKIKVEKYVFDYDMKVKSVDKMDFDQPAQVKSKFSWFNFRDKEVETVYGVTLEPDMFLKPVFKKKEITNYWSWFYGGYKTTIKTTDKLKPRSEDGKYRVRAYFDNNSTGEVIALLGAQEKMSDPVPSFMEYKIMVVNADLQVTSEVPFNMEYPYQPIYYGQYETSASADDAYEGDYVIIFSSIGKGVPGKQQSPNPDTYYYVRVSPQGKVVEKVPFTTKATDWRIEGVYLENGVATVYGPGKSVGKPDDAAMAMIMGNYIPEEKGFDNFQLVSIAGGKVKYVTAPTIDEMDKLTVAPAGQKKTSPYDGKRLRVTRLTTAANGDAIVAAQLVDKNFKTQQYTYKDFLAIHFDGSGKLKNVYSIDTPAKGGIYNTTDPLMSAQYYASKTDMFPSKDGKSMYWLTSLVTKIDKHQDETTNYLAGTKTITYTFVPREQMLISQIDLASGKMGEVSILGDGERGRKQFFLRRDIRYVSMNGGKDLLVIGEDRNSFGIFKGDNYIYLGRVALE